MLLQFSVENYLSFDALTHFSMRACKDNDHPQHVAGPEGFRAVRGAAIYGANAAGKSNLVLAMAFARDLVMRQNGATLAVLRPFGLGQKERPCGFHFVFTHDGRVWSYGFDALSDRVVEEYLVVQNPSEPVEHEWFMRKTNDEGKTTVEMGADFLAALEGDEKQLLGLLAPRTGSDELFLWRCLSNNIGAVAPVEVWFADVMSVVRAEAKYQPLLLLARDSSEFVDFASDFLRFADTGIECLDTTRRPVKLSQLLAAQASPEAGRFLEEQLASLSRGEVFLGGYDFVPLGVERDEEGNLWLIRLLARHKRDDGTTVDFPMEWESEGTQRLIHLLVGLFQFRTQESVIVIDELERRLHPKLTRRFLELAQQSPILGNQLIFTTHETALLDSLLLRRDEIFFARKKQNRTTLERLSEYAIRNDRSYEKAYELGRVGGGGPELSFEMFGLMGAEDSFEEVDEIEGVEALAAS